MCDISVCSSDCGGNMQMQGDIRRVLGLCLGVALAATAYVPAQPPTSLSQSAEAATDSKADTKPAVYPDIYIETYVTGYNTVAAQTDDTPCIAASGENICGRSDTVACPPLLEFGTVVEINGRHYVCADRMASRFRSRFDINCDKDKRCPRRVAGWYSVKIVSAEGRGARP